MQVIAHWYTRSPQCTSVPGLQDPVYRPCREGWEARWCLEVGTVGVPERPWSQSMDGSWSPRPAVGRQPAKPMRAIAHDLRLRWLVHWGTPKYRSARSGWPGRPGRAGVPRRPLGGGWQGAGLARTRREGRPGQARRVIPLASHARMGAPLGSAGAGSNPGPGVAFLWRRGGLVASVSVGHPSRKHVLPECRDAAAWRSGRPSGS